MSNEPMLSVEQELRSGVEKALLAMKHMYKAWYNGITAAGGTCTQPGIMFENDPTARELRVLLDKPAYPNRLCHADHTAHPYVCGCLKGDEEAQRRFDEHHSKVGSESAAQHQGEPVAWVIGTADGNGADYYPGKGLDTLEIGAKLYAEQPAPVAMAIPEECPHIIVFDDADREQLLFAGTGARAAALKTWEKISRSWNAHLFVRVERNSRDDRYPSGTSAPVEVVMSDVAAVQMDHNRLVRELDVLLNGEAGAAQQASLCDIVAQVRLKRDLLITSLNQGAPVDLHFPTMLRKMWSGGEVQQWIEAQGPLYRKAPVLSGANAALQRVYDVIGLDYSHDVSVLIENFKNIKRFADYLQAIEREFFMVPGEPSDEPEDAGSEPDDECLMNCWGSTQEQYVEQFRNALAYLASKAGPAGAGAPE